MNRPYLRWNIFSICSLRYNKCYINDNRRSLLRNNEIKIILDNIFFFSYNENFPICIFFSIKGTEIEQWWGKNLRSFLIIKWRRNDEEKIFISQEAFEGRNLILKCKSIINLSNASPRTSSTSHASSLTFDLRVSSN